LFQALRDEFGNEPASFVSGDAARQEFVIPRVRVAYVCANGQFDRTRLELFGRSGAPDSTRILPARVFSNGTLLFPRTPGKQVAHTSRELLDVLGIDLLTPFGRPLPSQLSGFRIGEAFLFRPCKSGLLDQHTLSLVPFPRMAEPHDHCT
jgi:hypothetical protein